MTPHRAGTSATSTIAHSACLNEPLHEYGFQMIQDGMVMT